VESVEKGVNNLQNFLFVNSASSRSEAGIQMKNYSGSIRFKPLPYLSDILKRFEERMSNFRFSL
jgi:hypothetical protein